MGNSFGSDTDAFLASLAATKAGAAERGAQFQAPVNPPMTSPQQVPNIWEGIENAMYQFSNFQRAELGPTHPGPGRPRKPKPPLTKLQEDCQQQQRSIFAELATAKVEQFEELQKRANRLQKLEEALKCCESPIEQLFLAALLELPDVEFSSEKNGFVWHSVFCLYLQVPVCERAHFVDFAVFIEDVPSFAIECDGYEYHSSKEVFEADRIRDRRILLEGMTVVHFSGTEIYHQAAECAQWVVEYARVLQEGQ
jgi:hypothetical protein